MKKILRVITILWNVIAQPKRVFSISEWKKLRKINKYLSKVDYSSKDAWIADTKHRNFKRKIYLSYDEYLEHQKSKIDVKPSGYLDEYETKFQEAFSQRLSAIDDIVSFKSKNVLCLAARKGAEVRSFLALGCFAVGIDLNPSMRNKYVVCGDFHNIQFPDLCIDIVYTNSFDHVFEPEKVLSEINRVLKNQGIFILEAAAMSKLKESTASFGYYYESFCWSEICHLTELIEGKGFSVKSRALFEYPWDGEQIVFCKISP